MILHTAKNCHKICDMAGRMSVSSQHTCVQLLQLANNNGGHVQCLR